MAAAARLFYTPEEYLRLEREAERKSEYVNGQIFAMAGGCSAHSLLACNIIAGLVSKLKARGIRVYNSDMRVRVSNTGLFTYPDGSVVCGKPQFVDSEEDTLTNPLVIFEVLSKSTEAYDRGDKFAHYRRLASVQHSRKHMMVQRYDRRPEEWALTEVIGPDGILELPALDCELPLSEIYSLVEFPDEGDGDGTAARAIVMSGG